MRSVGEPGSGKKNTVCQQRPICPKQYNDTCFRRSTSLVLISCLIYAQALLDVIFILRVRSVSKMLLSVKFAEDKVLTFLILCEKHAKIMQL